MFVESSNRISWQFSPYGSRGYAMQLDKPQPIRLLTTIARNSITHSRYMWQKCSHAKTHLRYMWQKCSHAKTHLRYMWHFPLHRWVQNVVSIPPNDSCFRKTATYKGNHIFQRNESATYKENRIQPANDVATVGNRRYRIQLKA